MVMRRATPTQLINLARGREKLFQNQLRRKGINTNPQPRTIIREVVRQSVVNHSTTHVHPIKVELALFNRLIETKLFTLETKNEKENLNLREILNRINSRLNSHWQKISVNSDNIDQIIEYVNSKNKEYSSKFDDLEKRVHVLEKESVELKKLVKKENENDSRNSQK